MENSPPQQNPLSQAPVQILSKGMTPQEVFSFFSNPQPVIDRARAAFLGNCDWIYRNGKMELVEWVVAELEIEETLPDGAKRKVREYQKIPLSPPQNMPLVDNYTLWSWIQAYISSHCSVYALLNKPDEPEDLATTIYLDIASYLHDNWDNYHMNRGKYQTICTLLGDMVADVIKASQNGDIRKVLTHVFSVNEMTDHTPKPPQGLVEMAKTALSGGGRQ